LARAGYLEAQQIVELSPLRAMDVQVELRAEPPPQPAAPPVAERVLEPTGRVEVLTVGALALGAVLLGSALAVQLSSSDAGASPTAAFLGGAGAGTTGLGAVLLYFDLTGAHAK
jgi:hypothetical protein